MAGLQPTELEIRNDSWKHSNHPAMIAEGGGGAETRTCMMHGLAI
jgi:hypothetical protein